MNSKWILILLVGVALAGCSKKQRKNLNIDSLPNALGSPFQVLVISDQNIINSEVGDSIMYSLTGPYLIVPIPESVLDLDFKDPRDFTGYVKHRRSIVILGTLDVENKSSKLIRNALGAENIRKAKGNKSFRFASQENKYARGQVIFYVFAPTLSELGDAISKAGPSIIKEVYKNDNAISKASAYAAGLNKEVMPEVKTKTGISMDIPKGYVKMNPEIMDDSTFWIKYETKDISYNLLIRKLGAGSEKDLTKDNLLKVRNQIGRKYVGTQKENSYMTTETMNKPFPVFKMTKLGDNLAMEGRGLWRTENDFMGGSFISYLAYNPNNNQVIFVEGFLYAPQKKNQRNYVERLKAILQTTKF